MSDLEGLIVFHYARVSNEAQDVDNSISVQSKVLDEFSNRHNQIVAGKYKDEAITGRMDRRPGFQQMLKDIEKSDPPVQAIVVRKLSRFARNKHDSAVHKYRLKKKGVRVISATEAFDDSPEGRLMEHIIEGMDAFYSENLSAEVSDGMRGVAEKGFFIGNRAPFGYKIKKVDDGKKKRQKLEIDPATAWIARRAFDTILSGQTMTDGVRAFNKEGILTADGKRWDTRKFHSLVTNEHYTGAIVQAKKSKSGRPPVITPNSHPAIVSVQEFEQVKQLLASRAPKVQNPRHAGSQHILSGLVRCRQCGFKYIYKSGTGRNGKHQYIECTTRVENGKTLCDGPRVRSDDLEPRTMNAILNDILTEGNLKRLMEEMKATAGDSYAEATAKVKQAEKELQEVSKREDRIILAYEKEELSLQKFSERMKDLKEMKISLEAAKESAIAGLGEEAALLETPQEILDYAAELNEFLRSTETSRCKNWLGKFVKCVWVEPGKGTIEYNIPVPDKTTGSFKTTTEILFDDPVHTSIPPSPLLSSPPLGFLPLILCTRACAPLRYP